VDGDTYLIARTFARKLARQALQDIDSQAGRDYEWRLTTVADVILEAYEAGLVEGRDDR